MTQTIEVRKVAVAVECCVTRKEGHGIRDRGHSRALSGSFAGLHIWKSLKLHIMIPVLVKRDQGDGRIVAASAAITRSREHSRKPAAMLNLKAIANNLMRSDNELEVIILAKLLGLFAGKRVQHAGAIARAWMAGPNGKFRAIYRIRPHDLINQRVWALVGYGALDSSKIV
jgi:hypothetical protein